MKLKKFIKKIVFFVIMIVIVTNTISFFKSERIDIVLPNFFPKETELVYFYTKWCPICKVESSEIEAVSSKFLVVKVDAEQKAEIAKLFKVKGYPTLFYIKNRKVVWSDVGYTSRFSIMIKSWVILKSFRF